MLADSTGDGVGSLNPLTGRSAVYMIFVQSGPHGPSLNPLTGRSAVYGYVRRSVPHPDLSQSPYGAFSCL